MTNTRSTACPPPARSLPAEPSIRAAGQYTIDQLAEASGVSVRNIRAHRTRGLLPAPDVRGRTGYYGSEHLARLQLIGEMQAKGFNLAAIKRILDAVPAGMGMEALGFERALLSWQTEEPEVVDARELARRFPASGEEFAARAVRLGLLVPLEGGRRFEIRSPMLLRAAEELVALGLPLEAGLAVHDELVRHARGVARAFVRIFSEEVWRPFEERGQPEAEWPQVREALDRMRPLAEQSLLATFRMMMDAEARATFGRARRTPRESESRHGFV